MADSDNSDDFFDAVEEIEGFTQDEAQNNMFQDQEEETKEQVNDFGEDFFFIKGSPAEERRQ